MSPRTRRNFRFVEPNQVPQDSVAADAVEVASAPLPAA
jgi:hypothetical protein